MHVSSSWIIATFLGLLSGTSMAVAACGQGKPAKHQLMIIWNGNNELLGSPGAFDLPVDEAVSLYGSKADKQWLALGGFLDKETKEFVPAVKPDASLTQNARFVEAGAEGLRKISKEVNAEYDDLRRRNPDLAADEVQVIFFVTNHGTLSTGKNGKKYGIAASPNVKTNNLSDHKAPQIDEEDLYQFAKSLPSGIRTKAIFAQCYGANTLESYLKGLQSNIGCGCGAASSDLNEVAYNTGWEQNVLRNSQGKSFSKGVSATRFNGDKNMSSTSSENYMYRYFLANKKIFGITAANAEEILLQSKLILSKAQATKKELNKEERDLLDDLARVHESGYYDWMLELNPSKTKQQLSYSAFDPNTSTKQKYSASKDPLIKAILKSETFRVIPPLEKDGSREQIVQAFLLSASSEEKKAYRDLFRCEQDPLDSQSPTGQDAKGGPDKARPHEGVR